MTEPSDEALMLLYRGGDRAAFQTLFRRYSAPLYRMMLRSRCAPAVAEDLVQQTFLHLHRARLDYREGAELRPYLFTIAMNLVRAHYRRAGRHPEEAVGTDGEIDRSVAADAERVLLEHENRARIRNAVAALPENQREVIELHWFQERPFEEIARVVGASLSAVKVRAHRGYKKLRNLLEES